ncbi:zinc-ribbon domain-containing protein [Burkholderia multivorans]|uniref:zinc-ribbon and DUF3426 domain-containing protein n=1 Tax=Burkholderia multivorans TaxID=87883 RepID=UPI000CFF4DB7|nr:zinc-ribbon and DUF3426 domain-containing protein [Burkholderia multivorans]MBJ9616906.1 zinc-ribbon domain-containing protein [Burkholderia multivorans]MBU9328506.1 zinc-ribbon domain-containing protein [Burkholderia multivorans]MBU9531796.1 zinc-ribbon domain-containing protein [Burkholderia multivorans]MDR8782123.1 hypothetical protein [Burkholderia multivorans]MDR8823116.1 hypothetical protein [Burkholderia multivorans]
MFLATRCPHCETVFRLQPEQLSLHQGLVRCGHCRQVFNAAQSLVPEHAQPPASPASEPTPVEPKPSDAAPPANLHDIDDTGNAAHADAPPRLLADAPRDVPPSADYKPEGWDMWAPWLDGSIDPALQHNGKTVRIEPLVPVALPSIEAGVVRLTGTPERTPRTREAEAASHAGDADGALPASSTSPHETDAALPPVAASAASSTETDTTLPPLTASADATAPVPPFAPSADTDAREPRFIAPVPTDAGNDADVPARPPHFAVPDDIDTPREPRFAAASAPATAAFAAADTRAPADEPFAAVPSDDDRPPFAVTREAREPQRRGVLGGFVGGLVAAALAVLLVAQLAWWQREPLMIHWPATQGWFRQLCAPLGCTVAPPRAIDGLRLDATDLRQLDGPRVLELKAPLTNRYRVALAYPSLELTLLDDSNHVTVRRVLAPREYVRPGTPIDAGLPPGTTQTMIVRLDTNGAPASNFRVQIFYP